MKLKKTSKQPKVKKIRSASNRTKFIGIALFALAFGGLGGLIVLRSRAATGVCSPSTVIGTATSSVSVPETAQYRLWVRMQVPDTTNTGNLNGVQIELVGANSQCFTVTTTAANAVNQWQWINSDANAASTAHVTASLPSGAYTAKIIGLKAGVKVDKVLLLKSDNTCTPSNTVSGSVQPGDNCTTPVPTVTITASPTSVTSGSSSALTWTSTNATSCTASGAWTGTRATSGTNVSTGALTTVGTSTFSITCSGVGGTSNAVSATVAVTAPPAPTVTLTANPTSVLTGNPSTLSWSSTNATSCTASGSWTGAKATAGDQSTGNLTANQTYNLSCTGPGGTTAATPVAITVTATPPPSDTTKPTVTIGVTGVTVSAGATALVKDQKSITWRPLASDASGIKTLALTVNGQPVTLTGGAYVFGGKDTGRNDNYELRVVATDNANNVQTVTVTIQLRHPDLNRDNIVDSSDFGLLLRNWNTQSNAYDLNVADGVDSSDFGILLRNWNSTL